MIVWLVRLTYYESVHTGILLIHPHVWKPSAFLLSTVQGVQGLIAVQDDTRESWEGTMILTLEN